MGWLYVQRKGTEDDSASKIVEIYVNLLLTTVLRHRKTATTRVPNRTDTALVWVRGIIISSDLMIGGSMSSTVGVNNCNFSIEG